MLRARVLATLTAGLFLTITMPPSFGQTLRIAMTASDTPTTTGIPNNGGEGFRFWGFPAFDGLINWDFTHPERIAGLTSGLASEWKIDDSYHTRWIFTLRDGVKFHDGTDVTVDAVIWNLECLFEAKHPDNPANGVVRGSRCEGRPVNTLRSGARRLAASARVASGRETAFSSRSACWEHRSLTHRAPDPGRSEGVEDHSNI
jgi:ABC-type transport system substrate-binding protein